mgnify:CR=1 FL=1
MRGQYSGHVISFDQSGPRCIPEKPLDDAIEHDAEVPALEGISPDQKNQLEPGEADAESREASDNVRLHVGPQQHL